jgi:hypothetical protein
MCHQPLSRGLPISSGRASARVPGIEDRQWVVRKENPFGPVCCRRRLQRRSGRPILGDVDELQGDVGDPVGSQRGGEGYAQRIAPSCRGSADPPLPSLLESGSPFRSGASCYEVRPGQYVSIVPVPAVKPSRTLSRARMTGWRGTAPSFRYRPTLIL